jgi:membrane carboxypeptidase/penicillin-binding protein
VVDHGSGAYAGGALGRPAAGKTGTSQESRSAWFSGFTPQLAASVGIYREIDGKTTSLSGLGGRSNVTGGSFPVRIWTAFMKGALEGAKVEDFPQPVYGGQVSNPAPTQTATTSPTSTPTPTTSPTATETASPTATETAPPTPTGPPTPSGSPSTEGAGQAGDKGGSTSTAAAARWPVLGVASRD